MKSETVFVLSILVILGFLFRYINSPTNYSSIFDQEFPVENFTTALGNVNIQEINENIFKYYDYSMIKSNSLIPMLQKIVPKSCDQIFLEWQKIAEKGLTKNPPKQIPNPKAFLLNGYATLSHYYFNETPNNSVESIKIWNQTYINELMEMAKNNNPHFFLPYGKESLSINAAFKDYNINGKIGAVIGSQTPWAEIYSLINGAKHVTTVDYQKIRIKHSKMDFIYAPEMPSLSKKYYGKFDFVVSFSSIEHSGLGRYGDPLDPIGDLREMNKIHCLLKNNGLFFLGLPAGKDSIAFNAHRIYGRIRLSMMFEGFELLSIYNNDAILPLAQIKQIFNGEYHQYLFVLRKKEL